MHADRSLSAMRSSACRREMPLFSTKSFLPSSSPLRCRADDTAFNVMPGNWAQIALLLLKFGIARELVYLCQHKERLSPRPLTVLTKFSQQSQFRGVEFAFLCRVYEKANVRVQPCGMHGMAVIVGPNGGVKTRGSQPANSLINTVGEFHRFTLVRDGKCLLTDKLIQEAALSVVVLSDDGDDGLVVFEQKPQSCHVVRSIWKYRNNIACCFLTTFARHAGSLFFEIGTSTITQAEQR